MKYFTRKEIGNLCNQILAEKFLIRKYSQVEKLVIRDLKGIIDNQAKNPKNAKKWACLHLFETVYAIPSGIKCGEKFLKDVFRTLNVEFTTDELEEAISKTILKTSWENFLKNPTNNVPLNKVLAKTIKISPEEFIERERYHKIYSILVRRNRELKDNNEIKLLFEVSALPDNEEQKLRIAGLREIRSIKKIPMHLLISYFKKINWSYVIDHEKDISRLFEDDELAFLLSKEIYYSPNIVIKKELSKCAISKILAGMISLDVVESDILIRMAIFQKNFFDAFNELPITDKNTLFMKHIPLDKELRRITKLLILGRIKLQNEETKDTVRAMLETFEWKLTDSVLVSIPAFVDFMKKYKNTRLQKSASENDQELFKI